MTVDDMIFLEAAAQGQTSGLLPSYPCGGFHDITLGANGLYAATPGFDYTTGLGSFIVNQFVVAVAK